MLKGALAAAVTPLRESGEVLDEDGFVRLADFLAGGGLDGILALGTTGEGILLSREERRRVTDLFVAACTGRLDVAVHCGAQTTADTVALAEHAATAGAAAVAVIGPPYFQLDDEALLAHFEAAAAACAPTPFYVYEFARVSGYAVPVRVVERLRDVAPNLAGMKVSDAPFDQVEPYLLEGLDIFVGAESLIGAGMERGAKGSVSALATAFPELIAAAVRDPSPERSAELRELRDGLEAFPRHAALKRILGLRGVPVREDVRAPLRGLDDDERRTPRCVGCGVAGAGEPVAPSEVRPALRLAVWGHPGHHPLSSLTGISARVCAALCRDGSEACRCRQSGRPRSPAVRARAGAGVAAYIRKIPKVVSGMGAFRAAEMPSAITLRVSTGSMIPSSQRRAVE